MKNADHLLLSCFGRGKGRVRGRLALRTYSWAEGLGRWTVALALANIFTLPFTCPAARAIAIGTPSVDRVIQMDSGGPTAKMQSLADTGKELEVGERMKLSKESIAADPNLLWNSFIDFMGTARKDQFSETQAFARAALTYMGQVYNGGHLQYFENYGLGEARKALRALKELGFARHMAILDGAIEQADGQHWGGIETAEEYVERAAEGEFEQFDARFYNEDPNLQVLLENFVEQHPEYFFEFVE